jgi:sterol 24-C-methyltransferase
MFTPRVRIEQLEEAGFDMLFDEDRATAKGNPVPWW